MPKVLKAEGMNKCIGCFTCMLACAGVNKRNHSISKSAIRVRTSGGLKGKFVADVCIACNDERACAEACPSGALKPRSGGGVTLEAEKCIGCKRCMEACIVGAVFFDEAAGRPIICKHCGVCTQFCPHECLRMEETADAV